MRYHLPLLLVLAACGGDSSGPQILPASIQLVGGTDQIATVAKELPQQIEVRVLDASAGPVRNYPVNWTALDGSQVFAAVVYSGTDGIARQRVTLGSQAWVNGDPAMGRLRQRTVARLLDPETGAVMVDDTVYSTARPDVATQLDLGNAGGVVGDSTGVAVTYRDQFDNMLAPCPSGDRTDLVWTSADSSIAEPTGQLFTGPDFDGDSPLYGYVRAKAEGTTTITVHANCIGATAEIQFTVIP